MGNDEQAPGLCQDTRILFAQIKQPHLGAGHALPRGSRKRVGTYPGPPAPLFFVLMPSRIIREGILTSDRIELLDVASEVFYRRLMNKIDDHGLYDARLPVLRSSLYPLRLSRVHEVDISRWLAKCAKAGLIVLYENDGKPYLKVLDTRWKVRSEPKYPTPPCGKPVETVDKKRVLADGSRC